MIEALNTLLILMGLETLFGWVTGAISAATTPRCPKCYSTGASVKLVCERRRWQCGECGHKYRVRR